MEKSAVFYSVLVSQLYKCIEDLEDSIDKGFADGGQGEKELLNHFSSFFWGLSIGLNERAETIKGAEE